MRPLVAFLLLWGVLPSSFGQSLRLATWDLDGFESAPLALGPSEVELKRLRQAAAQLRPVDADILVVQGLSDVQFARGLASFLRPNVYHVAIHSRFKKTGTNALVGSPITVLSKRTPYLARSMEWRATGQIDLPGGFAFVGFSAGTNALCVYVAQLPGDPAAVFHEGGDVLTARRRELAGQYLVHHANWLAGSLNHPSTSLLLAGNYSVPAGTGPAEAAVRTLQQAGFKVAFPPGQPTGPTERNPHAFSFLTGLMTRGGQLDATPQQLVRRPFVQPIVIYNLRLGASGATSAEATASTVAASMGPLQARLVGLDPRIVWLWVGGIGALSLTIIFAVWQMRRAATGPQPFRRRADSAVVVDLSGFSSREPAGFHRATKQSYSGSTGDSSHTEAALWQARALQATERADQVAVAARSGVMLQVRRLLRHRLFAWLNSQRTHLLESHEAGTRHVLDLEERLRGIQRQFEERLQIRDERIADLERGILAKEKVIRDLLRAQVRSASDSSDHYAGDR